MNREDIIRMAREAGIDPDLWNHTDAFERLAHSAYAAGAAAEREECAKLCDELNDADYDINGYGCAAAIRARSVL